MIPIKNLGKYIKVRSKPEGYEWRTIKKEAALLDRLCKTLSRKSNYRFWFEDERFGDENW
jgi:hypothetical protein